MKSIFRRLLAFSLLIVPALAADTGGLRGFVHDPQHRPLPGAQVIIHNPRSTFNKTVISDANGEFQVNDLPAVLIPSPSPRRASGQWSDRKRSPLAEGPLCTSNSNSGQEYNRRSLRGCQ
jgi:hypothetical protein